MMGIRFRQVDVFTTSPFRGNPVAVILDAASLTTDQMQTIANWMNLSETAFVLPATDARANYRIRIFTPHAELPFAGHPTIGTAHALLESGLIAATHGALVQQCGSGLVRLAVERGGDNTQWISFDLPEPKIRALGDVQAQDLMSVLNAPLSDNSEPHLIDVGPRWVVAQLPSAQAVLAVQPDFQCMKTQNSRDENTGVVIFGKHDPGMQAKIEVRAFAPAVGVDEDPVCGSGNGCVAAYIRHTGQTAEFGDHFLSTQGTAVGRAGILKLTIADKAIRIGGTAITCIEGTLYP